MDMARAVANAMLSTMSITAVYDTIINDDEEVTTSAATEPPETNTVNCAGWSDHSEPEEDESVQRDSTDEEHSDTSTDELP